MTGNANANAHFDKFIHFHEWKAFLNKFPPIDVDWIPQICIVPYEGFCIHMYLNVEWEEELNGIHAMKKANNLHYFILICLISFFIQFPQSKKSQLFFDDFTIYTQ
jgi:hypothetical protein